MVHLLIDEWWCKLLRQRFIAIRIRYVDPNFELVTFLLSIRHYDKSTVHPDVKLASEILMHWTRGILNEYGITIAMIYSSTTDAGPEVRCMITKYFKLPWEWCIPHLLANAVKETWGQLASQKKNNTETEIRNLLEKINAMIARIKNTESALDALEVIVREKFGRKLVLVSYLDIRFLGVVVVLERIIKLWSCLVLLYQSHFGQTFPLDDYNLIEQLFGTFRSVRFIQEHSQTRSHPVTCTTFLMLMDLDKP